MVLLPQDPTVCQTLTARSPFRHAFQDHPSREHPYWLPAQSRRPYLLIFHP